VGNLQPLRKLVSRGVGRLTVKRHHRRRQAGHAPQLRTPPISYGRDFNLVRTPANGFFEAMNVHVFGCPCEVRSGVDSTRRGGSIKRSGSRRRGVQRRIERSAPIDATEKIFISRISTGFAPIIDRFSTALTMTRSVVMCRLACALLFVLLALLARRADAATPTLFHLFLIDGTDITSYGEYARVGDDVVFSITAGGSAEDPRLQLVTLPAKNVDWVRTDRANESVRAAHYAATRGDEDFQYLSNEVARVLNEIAVSPDRARALALAQRAHEVLVQWPKDHYQYRANEVREIQSIVDNAIATLRGQPVAAFELSLVASGADLVREPPATVPTAQTQLAQLLRVADLTGRAADRVALLQTALGVLEENAPRYAPAEWSSLRDTIKDRIDREEDVDRRYSQMSQRLLDAASRAAASAKASDVERVLARVARQDQKLGGTRPETVQAIRASIETHLENARRLRLLRDQWILRQSAYRSYQSRVGNQIAQLVKAQPQLEAIRRLDGPSPRRLLSLMNRLGGGANHLERLDVPPELKSAHELLVGAWRFAENAAAGRFEAANTGNVTTAWMASSAAAGSMMLLSRAQTEIRTLLEIPTIK
jgi:hypothetical protein